MIMYKINVVLHVCLINNTNITSIPMNTSYQYTHAQCTYNIYIQYRKHVQKHTVRCCANNTSHIL